MSRAWVWFLPVLLIRLLLGALKPIDGNWRGNYIRREVRCAKGLKRFSLNTSTRDRITNMLARQIESVNEMLKAKNNKIERMLDILWNRMSLKASTGDDGSFKTKAVVLISRDKKTKPQIAASILLTVIFNSSISCCILLVNPNEYSSMRKTFIKLG